MPPILHDEIENNRTLLLTNIIGPKLKMCICAFSFKSFSPFHIPRATFVNLLYDKITKYLDDSKNLFMYTPPIAEILCVINPRAIVVCGFLMKSLKKNMLKV